PAAILLLLAGAVVPPLTAQEEPQPTVVGGLAIGLSDGTLSGDFCLSPPTMKDTLTIVLNRSLSIVSVRGGRLLPELSVEQPGGAALRHKVVRGARPAGSLPEPVCVVYEGAERVYDVRKGEYRENDSSEVIAFNGTTVRARG